MAANDPRMLIQTLETLTSQLDRSEIQSRETVQTAENMQRHMDEVAMQIERLAFTFTEQAREDEQLAPEPDAERRDLATIVQYHRSTRCDICAGQSDARQSRRHFRRLSDAAGGSHTRARPCARRRQARKEKTFVVRDMLTAADQKFKAAVRDLRACQAGNKATKDCSSARATVQRTQQRHGEVKKLYRFATDNLAKAEAALQEAEEKVAAAQLSVTNAEEAITLAESAIAAAKQGMVFAATAQQEELLAVQCSTQLLTNAQQESQNANAVMQTSKTATDKSTEGMTSIQKAIDQQANASDLSRLGREDLRQRMEHLEAINRATEIHQ